MLFFIRVFLLALCLTQTAFAGKALFFSVLSLDQATKKVIESSSIKVLAAKTEQVDGKDVHVIKVLTTDGRIQHIKINAESGEVVK